jgi:tetratricopeptide (TPR) repeat protein
LKEKYSTPSDLALSLYNLADLYLAQNRLDEAEADARRALAIDQTLDPAAAEIWKDYSFFAQIAEKRGQMEVAQEWRRKEQESFAAFAGSDVDANIQGFEPLIQAIVAATNGNEDTRKQVEANFETLKAHGWEFVDAVKAIWAGERDAGKLTEGIDRNSALVVRRILQALEGGPQSPAPLSPSGGSPKSRADLGEGEQAHEGITLPQLLELVERAAGRERELGTQLAPAVEQMAKDFNAPPEIRAFGIALRDILYGGRNPDLSQLPDELASAVRGLLGRLKNG